MVEGAKSNIDALSPKGMKLRALQLVKRFHPDQLPLPEQLTEKEKEYILASANAVLQHLTLIKDNATNGVTATRWESDDFTKHQKPAFVYWTNKQPGSGTLEKSEKKIKIGTPAEFLELLEGLLGSAISQEELEKEFGPILTLLSGATTPEFLKRNVYKQYTLKKGQRPDLSPKHFDWIEKQIDGKAHEIFKNILTNTTELGALKQIRDTIAHSADSFPFLREETRTSLLSIYDEKVQNTLLVRLKSITDLARNPQTVVDIKAEAVDAFDYKPDHVHRTSTLSKLNAEIDRAAFNACLKEAKRTPLNGLQALREQFARFPFATSQAKTLRIEIDKWASSLFTTEARSAVSAGTSQEKLTRLVDIQAQVDAFGLTTGVHEQTRELFDRFASDTFIGDLNTHVASGNREITPLMELSRLALDFPFFRAETRETIVAAIAPVALDILREQVNTATSIQALAQIRRDSTHFPFFPEETAEIESTIAAVVSTILTEQLKQRLTITDIRAAKTALQRLTTTGTLAVTLSYEIATLDSRAHNFYTRQIKDARSIGELGLRKQDILTFPFEPNVLNRVLIEAFEKGKTLFIPKLESMYGRIGEVEKTLVEARTFFTPTSTPALLNIRNMVLDRIEWHAEKILSAEIAQSRSYLGAEAIAKKVVAFPFTPGSPRIARLTAEAESRGNGLP